MIFNSLYKERKVPFRYLPTICALRWDKIKNKISRKVRYNVKKRKRVLFPSSTRKMKGILKNASQYKLYEDPRPPGQEPTVRFGYVKYYSNNKNPNRLSYFLALRQRQARRNVIQLAINKRQRRAERAACAKNGLHCDQSGNSYPFMTNMRTFINSARNAVVMEGYTAARKIRFAAKKIVIKPRSGLRKLLRMRAATI